MCFVCVCLVTKLVGCLFVCLLVFVCCLCVCLAVCLIGYSMDPKEGLPRPFQGPLRSNSMYTLCGVDSRCVGGGGECGVEWSCASLSGCSVGSGCVGGCGGECSAEWT